MLIKKQHLYPWTLYRAPIWHSLTKFIKYKTELEKKKVRKQIWEWLNVRVNTYLGFIGIQFTRLIDRKSSSVQTNASVYTLLIEHMVQFLRTVVLLFFLSKCFKGPVSRDFLLHFSWIILPQAPGHNKRVISNFSKIRGDIWTIGINDTSGKFAAGATAVIDTGCKYLPESSKKFETAMVYLGTWGKLIHEKNLKSKISWHCL